jgi:ribonuclease HI
MSLFYAVARGRNIGIYETWSEAKNQVDHFFAAKFKKFATREEAEQYLSDNKETPSDTPQFILSKCVETPQEGDKTLICFTDGSALANGKKNCKAASAVIWPYHEEFDYAEPLLNCIPTNNRAEYSALIHAFRIADEIDPLKEKHLIVYTDSMLLINSITKWFSNWKRNNFKKSDGEPVLNLDLLLKIDLYKNKRPLTLRHVRAHTGKNTWEARYNDKVDKLAKSAAIKQIK